jgi:intein/homing endonuclease
MNKARLFYKFSDYTAKQNRGTYWVSLLQTYFDPQKILMYSGLTKILYPEIPNGILFIFFGFVFLLAEGVKVVIGHYDVKLGIWKKQNEYNQKEKHMNPFNNELQDTIKEICKKLKIKHRFKSLQ